LEKKGPELQALVHKRGFGTASVTELLEPHKKEVQRIAKEAGVDILVSKWDILHQSPGVPLVDLTEPLARLFQPDTATWKVIEDIRDTEPVPNHALEDHRH